jgi:hypothetical protein
MAENLKERNHLGEEGIEGRIILKGIFEETGTMGWTIGVRIPSGAENVFSDVVSSPARGLFPWE